MEIFEIPLENLSRKNILQKIYFSFDQKQPLRIVTVNPEYLLEARKNKTFRENIQAADMRVVDGFGIVLVAWLLGKKLMRYPGADLLLDILSLAKAKEIPVALLIKDGGLSSFEEIQEKLLKHYPRLRLSGEDESYSLTLCNYGAPAQDFLLAELSERSLSLGVGGAFDFLTGKLPRAPKFLQSLGLEWLWRLWLQPKRLKRIWNAVVVFPILVLFGTMKK